MYTLTAYKNGKFRFCWTIEDKEEAIVEGMKWMRLNHGFVEVCRDSGDVVWAKGA
jgi:hypothetical protein